MGPPSGGPQPDETFLHTVTSRIEPPIAWATAASLRNAKVIESTDSSDSVSHKEISKFPSLGRLVFQPMLPFLRCCCEHVLEVAFPADARHFR